MKIRSLFTVLFFSVTSGLASAQDINLDSTTLEDLLNVKTTVATKKEQTARSSPGIVSIITAEEIKNLGARDLIDVLRLVPSINFGFDVQGVVGLGIRGLWGHEGKILLLVDGIEMNETQYATTHFGNEFPVDQISKIEIIRGPGSSVYGGFAELAVINIVTKSGSDLKGFAGQATFGQMVNDTGRTNLSLSYGDVSGDWDYSIKTSLSKAQRGEGTYTGVDTSGSPPFPTETYDFSDADEIEPSQVNLGLKNKNLNARFIYDRYKLTTRSMFGYTGITENIPNTFISYNGLLSYKFDVNDSLHVTPSVQYNYQIPWLQESEGADIVYQRVDIRSARIKSGLNISYDISNWNLQAGYEYIDDQHEIKKNDDVPPNANPFNNGTYKFGLSTRAVYAQAVADLELFDLTFGARYDNTSLTESSFVPRVGLTKSEKNWHSKLLYSQAFKTPVLFNIDLQPGIKPEKTDTLELEFGFTTSKNSYLTTNIYNTLIKDPIVYGTVASDENYNNFEKIGARGLELDWRYKPTWGQIQFGYAYYENFDNKVPNYQVTGKEKIAMGFPQHQAVLNGWYKINGNVKVNPSLFYMSDKYAQEFDPADLDDGLSTKNLPSILLSNIYVSKENVLIKDLTAGVGVLNIFNQDFVYAQPYTGDHSPVPGPSREFLVRLDYQKTF